ncbi:unnamed protein product [Pylaiella littoralis]
MGATVAEVALLLCMLTCTHAVTRTTQDSALAFVHQASSAAASFGKMRRMRSSRNQHAASPALTSSRHRHFSSSTGHRSTQERIRHCRRTTTGVTALNMAGFWAKPSLQEVSVLDLPVLQQGSDSDGDIAVVYFTACDLRTHDHDGLVAAAGAAGVVPVYVFDDQELAAESRLDAAFAFHAVQDLRETLRGIGSDLVVRSGDAAEEIARLVDQSRASHVFFHSSPVHALRKSHERVRASLASSRRRQQHHENDGAAAAPAVDVRSWSSSQLTGVEGHDPAKAWNFRDFEKRLRSGEPARSAFPAPVSLPPIPSGVEAGPFPRLEEVLSRVGSRDSQVQEALMTASLDEAPFGALNLCVEGYGESRALRLLDEYLSKSEVEFARSVFGPEDGEPRAGTAEKETGLEAVTTRRIVKARGYGGLAPGEALARALGVSLALGCISPRRMFLARQPDYQPSPPPTTTSAASQVGQSSRRARSKCWARELAVIESWHSLLAERDITVGNSQGQAMEQRYLRWHGWLVRYALGGSQNPAAPTALLVHGFGASSDQWDRVFQEFSPEKKTSTTSGVVSPARSGDGDSLEEEKEEEQPQHQPSPDGGTPAAGDDAAGAAAVEGVRLLALDLVGFGHSAKPPLSFSQYSWADCARDVALRAGGGPFFIAGNSIGGYISMGVAADCKELCQGVVLVNSAGRVLTEKEFRAEATLKYDGLSVEEATRGGKLEAYSAPPNVALAVLGKGLFAFLQGRIAETCRNVYPVNPGIVDEGLAENILRDSCDPGAVGVIAAGGKLPFSRSANEMLGKFGGPVLVTQGVKDPLNDAEGRAKLLEGLGPQVSVVRLDGGHCPHHEVAEEVCAAVSGFVQRVDKDRTVLAQSA